MAHFSFDTGSVEKRESNYELLPAGWYTAQVINTEIVPLKSGNGSALKLTFEVLNDGYRNRKLWLRLNVKHSNPEAERISQMQLGELCDSIGLARFQDTVELHNKPVQIKVKIRKDETGQYEDQNEINGFKLAAGAKFMETSTGARAVTLPASTGAAAAAIAANPVPPWQKRAA